MSCVRFDVHLAIDLIRLQMGLGSADDLGETFGISRLIARDGRS
jgi:hypothetical protein